MNPLLRPMLADVTDALGWCRNCDGKGWIVTTTGDGSHGTLEQETCPNCDGNGCEVYEPADALETLHTRGLWPWYTEGEHAARWWCPSCSGRGCVGGVWVGENYVDADVCDVCSVEDLNTTGGYAVRGWLAGPPLPRDLAAVASLGAGALLRAASLAADIARAAEHPTARPVWRCTMTEEIRRHHAKRCAGESASPVLVFSREMTPPLSNFEWRPAWPEACPYSGMFGTPDNDRHGIHRAWHALRALAATGLHLLSLDSDSVVLGVEALS